MTNRMTAYLMTGFFAGLVSATQAAEIEQCPTEINVLERVENAGAGWQTIDGQQKHAYIGVAFSDGSPTQQITLAPDEERKTRRGVTSTWKFAPSRTGYWVSCLYAGTGAGINRKLPLETESCVVEYERRKSALVTMSWSCSMRGAK